MNKYVVKKIKAKSSENCTELFFQTTLGPLPRLRSILQTISSKQIWKIVVRTDIYWNEDLLNKFEPNAVSALCRLNYLPVGKNVGRCLNKHESPSLKHAVKLGLWFWRRRFLNVVNTFSLFSFGEGRSSSFEQTGIPLTKDDLCQLWLKLAQWFWVRRCQCIFTSPWKRLHVASH